MQLRHANSCDSPRLLDFAIGLVDSRLLLRVEEHRTRYQNGMNQKQNYS